MLGQIFYARLRTFFMSHLSIPVMNVFKNQCPHTVNAPGHFFFCGAAASTGPGPPHFEASRSHSDTKHSVGLLWTSDKPAAETTHNTQHWKQTSCPRWESNRQSQQASNRRPAPRTARPLESAPALLQMLIMWLTSLYCRHFYAPSKLCRFTSQCEVSLVHVFQPYCYSCLSKYGSNNVWCRMHYL